MLCLPSLFPGIHECPPWYSIFHASYTVTVYQFFCFLHLYFGKYKTIWRQNAIRWGDIKINLKSCKSSYYIYLLLAYKSKHITSESVNKSQTELHLKLRCSRLTSTGKDRVIIKWSCAAHALRLSVCTCIMMGDKKMARNWCLYGHIKEPWQLNAVYANNIRLSWPMQINLERFPKCDDKITQMTNVS